MSVIRLLFLLFSSVSSWSLGSWVSQSHEVFLPANMKQIAADTREYPLFWWNFVVLDAPEQPAEVCARLALEHHDDLFKLPCQFSVEELRRQTQDWLKDLPLRQDFPAPEAFAGALDRGLARASLPMKRELLDLTRLDPLHALEDLKSKLEQRLQGRISASQLQDHGRSLLPLQFAFAPSDTLRTRAFLDRLINLCPRCVLFGPHAATLENETQIRTDVEIVSKVGSLALLLLCLFLIGTRRARILTLLPLLALSIAAATGVTVWTFGRIHGLVLAFGPGIIGLAMDYGIHSCFLGPRETKTWRANRVGILTTVVSLIVLGCSSIPLLRQLMFYSTLGIGFSYATFYFILRRFPAAFQVETYRLTPGESRPLHALALGLLVAAGGLFFLPFRLDVQHFNFESQATVERRDWVLSLTHPPIPYVLSEDLSDAEAHRQWATQNHIEYEGLANWLPSVVEQEHHLQSWKAAFCPEFHSTLTTAQKIFYQPFLQLHPCVGLVPRDLHLSPPDYLKDFSDKGHYLGVFFPKPDQVATLRRAYPGVSTPREIFDGFPRLFFAELLWMVPLSFLGAYLFLWHHYRSALWATLAVLPFFSGAGAYALVALSFHLSVSFMSLIGLLMVFGCSLDYGVFVMDFLLYRDQARPSVWSALSVCAFATVAGFAPLVFAKHPVLSDLGHALLWGTVGTYIGALWGIPGLRRLLRLNEAT